jgi:transcriptional regulator with XRE-family HTH domain
MKFTDYKRKIQQDEEFAKVSEDLKLNFDLANAILRARIKKGWSQSKLAKAVGTQQANISRIETGTANPTITIVNKLIIALGLEIRIVPIGFVAPPKIDFGTIKPKTEEKIYVATWPTSTCGPNFNTNNTKSETMIKEGIFND